MFTLHLTVSSYEQVKLLSGFCSEEKAAEIESYFASNPWPGTERAVQQTVESIRLNAEWISRDSEVIRNFLIPA